MMQRRAFLVMLALTPALTGCGTLKKFTGQRNDTILPGERENVLPEEQQRNQRTGPSTTGAPCDPTVDINCTPSKSNDAAAPEEPQ